MDQSSSGRSSGSGRSSRSNRSFRGQGGRQRNHRKGESERGRRGGGGGGRRTTPAPTIWQKIVKAVTFGRVDPAQSKRPRGKEVPPRPDRGGKSDGRKEGKKEGRRKSERSSRLVEPTTPRLYVGNLDYGTSDEDLEQYFSAVGTVVSASVVRRGGSEQSKGFAFVEMGSVDEAKGAAEKLNEVEFQGRRLLVTGAKAEKPSHESASGREPSEDRRSGRESRSGDRGGERRDRRGGREGEGGERRRSGGREGRGAGRGARGGGEGLGEDRGDRQMKAREVEVVSTSVLLVSQVNAEATPEDMTDLFADTGSFETCVPVESSGGGATREFLVTFSSVEVAQNALQLLHGKSFMGQMVRLSAAPEGVAATGEGFAPIVSSSSDVRAPGPVESGEDEAAPDPATTESAPERFEEVETSDVRENITQESASLGEVTNDAGPGDAAEPTSEGTKDPGADIDTEAAPPSDPAPKQP